MIVDFKTFIKNLIKSLDSLQEDIRKIVFFLPYELEMIKNSLTPFICDKKCPFCFRLCGEEDPKHTQHKVKYGHQVRALTGWRLSTNSKANLSTCSEIRDNNLISFNGHVQTWRDIKNYYQR